MEFVILGFLMIRSLSQYDLLKALSKEVSPFYQPSLGSIQNGIKKLLSKGHISKKSISDSRRKKYEYTITKSGEDYLKEWMLSSYSSSKFDMEFNTRLFFLGHLDKEDRKSVLKNTRFYIENTLKSFYLEEKAIHDSFNNTKMSDIVKYQVKTLQVGIHSYQSILTWILNEIKSLEGIQ